MIEKRNSKKGIYLLLFLSALAFVFSKIFQNLKEDFKIQGRIGSFAQDFQSCTKNGASLAFNSLNKESDYKVVELRESETIKLSDKNIEILGSCSEGFSNFLRLNEAEVCMGGSGQLNYEGGVEHSSAVEVHKYAKFKLIEVWYPLAFWLGNFEYIDSNKQISNRSTEYRGSGEQIDENYQARNLAPKEANIFRKEVSNTVRQNFALESEVFSAGVDKDPKQEWGKYIVKNKDNAVCSCSPDVAVSDYNVGKSNYIASNKTSYGGYNRMQVPKGDNYESERSGCLGESVKYEDIKDGVFMACNDVLALIKGWFFATFSPPQWQGCSEGECLNYNSSGQCTERGNKTNDCLSTENITVKMPSIFGEPYKCTTELCANAFLTYLQRAALDPKSATNKKITSENTDESFMFFVATPCKVEIEGTNVYINVKCLWDASPLLANYNLQRKDTAPRSDKKKARAIDYPKTFGDYWRNTSKAISKSAEYYNIPSF